MATYLELSALMSNDDLRLKVATAVRVKAEAVRAMTGPLPDAVQKKWADKAFTNGSSEANRFLAALLGANSSATEAAIIAASDATIQNAVDDVFQLFADADAGV